MRVLHSVKQTRGVIGEFDSRQTGWGLGNILLQYPIHLVESDISDHLPSRASDGFSATGCIVCETGCLTERFGDRAGAVALVIVRCSGVIPRIFHLCEVACVIVDVGGGSRGAAAISCSYCTRAPIVVIDDLALFAAGKDDKGNVRIREAISVGSVIAV